MGEIFLKLAEWNIHKMTNDILVKQFVIDKLIDVDADVICLLEYLRDTGIEENLKEKYWFEESNTISGNKVFIAVKKELAPGGIKVKNKNEVIGCYNFLHIEFLMQNGEPLSVIGVRMLSPIDASKQTPSLQKYISGLSTSFLCTGDFNIKDYRMDKWFPNISTEKMINTLSRLFRYNLRTQTSIMPLEQEVKIMDDYMYLQQMRFGKRIKYICDVDESCMKELVPTFVLQPLIENAIIHGLSYVFIIFLRYHPYLTKHYIHYFSICKNLTPPLIVM